MARASWYFLLMFRLVVLVFSNVLVLAATAGFADAQPPSWNDSTAKAITLPPAPRPVDPTTPRRTCRAFADR